MRLLIFALAALSSLSIARSDAAEGTSRPFEGVWEACQSGRGERICQYYILKQKNGRICGLWHAFADHRDFDGRLIADAEGLASHVRFVCGRPGSETRKDCAGDAVPFTPSEWEPTDKPLLICGNRLFDALTGSEQSCADIGKAPGLPRVSQFAQPSVSESDRDWMKACLDDIAYPPPDIRK
jgi:hypothetical protein